MEVKAGMPSTSGETRRKKPVFHSQAMSVIYTVYKYIKEKNPNSSERKLNEIIKHVARLMSL